MTRLHRDRAGRCGRDWRRSLDGVVAASPFYVRKEWKTSKMKRRDGGGGGGGNAVGGNVAYFAQRDEDPHRDAHQRQSHQYEGESAFDGGMDVQNVKVRVL